MDLSKVKVINIMKDGTICEDLSTYISAEHPLPEGVKRLMLGFIKAGRAIREKEGG